MVITFHIFNILTKFFQNHIYVRFFQHSGGGTNHNNKKVETSCINRKFRLYIFNLFDKLMRSLKSIVRYIIKFIHYIIYAIEDCKILFRSIALLIFFDSSSCQDTDICPLICNNIQQSLIVIK